MAVEREEWDDVRETTLQSPRSVKNEEGRTCLKCWSRKPSLAAHDEDHGEAGCSAAVHGGPWWRRSPPVPVEGTPCWSRGMPEGSYDPMGSPVREQGPARTCRSMERGTHAKAGLLAGLVTLWGTHAEAAFSWRTAPRGKDPHWGSLSRAAARGKDSRWRRLWRTVCFGRDPMLEQGQRVRLLPPEEKGAAETTCDELTTAPIPRPPALLRGRRERNRSEAEPRKKGGVGGRCFKIWIYFSLSYSDLIGDELNSLFSTSSVCFASDSNWWVISPCPCLDPGAFHHISSPLPSWGGAVPEQF